MSNAENINHIPPNEPASEQADTSLSDINELATDTRISFCIILNTPETDRTLPFQQRKLQTSTNIRTSRQPVEAWILQHDASATFQPPIEGDQHSRVLFVDMTQEKFDSLHTAENRPSEVELIDVPDPNMRLTAHT